MHDIPRIAILVFSCLFVGCLASSTAAVADGHTTVRKPYAVMCQEGEYTITDVKDRDLIGGDDDGFESAVINEENVREYTDSAEETNEWGPYIRGVVNVSLPFLWSEEPITTNISLQRVDGPIVDKTVDSGECLVIDATLLGDRGPVDRPNGFRWSYRADVSTSG